MSNPLADQLYSALNRYSRKEEAMESNNLIGRRVRFHGNDAYEAGVIVAAWSHELALMLAVDVDGLLTTWSVDEAPFTLSSDQERLD